MSKALAETVLEQLVTATLLLDESLTVCYLNPSAEQLFGQSKSRCIHQHLPEMVDHSSIDFSVFEQPLISGQSITDSGVTFVIDGKPLLLELTISPVSWEKKLMLLVELRQVDQQRRLNQELNQHAQQQAAKLLVRSLAHEIKNPLGGLRGAAQLLEKMLPSESLREYTQIIIEQADRLRNLVDRLLGPQRLGTKKPENVHVILEKVRQLVALEVGDNVRIQRDYDPSLPDIEMDCEQIEQALLNIVSNAAQILQGNSDALITLTTRTEHQVNIHGERVKLAAKIEIVDNGPGIKPELLDTLFYPMVSGREGGTGLGLSISQNLVDQHHGKIDVDSWPGKTTFTVYLPILDY
ncbi:two-component system sensor histidine kinase NtrB [Vibrio sp. UCD-FRSSP16_10]|uniref:nitrogen regulation protein NR(II) n=1 Tax=unclassified Vibrio TaxID=2614977 RepID=UPI000800AB36|nr:MULTISPECIES: nitrogen regulation protein NR(II) [unclassified Vibrio]OBT10157.1 two-component system sensor histidine kinase NtrB [Vibrio sp. UCD-FRSSP16_30]OBT18947.1 two-component system sensor histidine kinase NtrB [Vibrio sp. UCD-FRSSP16_10]